MQSERNDSPMAIPLTCPGCKARVKAPAASAGHTLPCPRCGAPVAVPDPLAGVSLTLDDEPQAAAALPAISIGLGAVGSMLGFISLVGSLAGRPGRYR